MFHNDGMLGRCVVRIAMLLGKGREDSCKPYKWCVAEEKEGTSVGRNQGMSNQIKRQRVITTWQQTLCKRGKNAKNTKKSC